MSDAERDDTRPGADIEHLAEVRDALLSDDLVAARFSGAQRGAALPWTQITVRPVLVRGERQVQVVSSDGRQDVTQNYLRGKAATVINALLAQPFKSIVIDLTDRILRVQFSKKGRPILHEASRPAEIPLVLAHDRPKNVLLADDEPLPFLQELGIMTADGRVRADQRRKFRQINEFLRLLDESGEVRPPDDGPLHVIDLGCGNAALTFATYYYFNEIKQIPTTLTGVDVKPHLIDKHQATAERLGWEGLNFAQGEIAAYEPATPPDIVLALHACDTATDDSLAQGVRWGSRLILSAPCCHHHLQAQLATSETPDHFDAVLRHSILRERLGDTLTDAFRAQLLQMLGYRTDVIEFVPVEHTPKNLMIRAVYDPARAQPEAATRDYDTLHTYWQVTPYLAELLALELAPLMSQPTLP
jgi:SAM-dependent methyltransferase